MKTSMYLRIQRNQLFDILSHCQSVVEKKTTQPILSHVLFDVKDKTLSLSATDLEVGIRYQVPLDEGETGRVTVSAKAIMDIVKELPTGNVDISRKDNDWLEIVSGRSRFKVVSLSASEYPVMPNFEEKIFLKARAEAFKQMIDRTSFAVSTDSTRYLMGGVYLEPLDSNLMRMVATDGHRLAHMDSEIFEKSHDLKKGVLIPKKGLTELRKFLEPVEADIGLSVEKGFLYVKTDIGYLFVRLIEGDYPDYRQVLPNQTPHSVVLNREEFTGALKRVSLLANEKSRAVKFKLTKDLLTISSNNPDLGEALEEVPAQYQGEDAVLGFNAKYVLEYLQVSTAANLELKFKDPLSPGLFKAEGTPNHSYIIMPMRL